MNYSTLRSSLLACTIVARRRYAPRRLGRPGPRRRVLPRHSDQPSRPRLRGGTVFEHGVGHRSRRQQAARRDPPRRSPARQFQPALQGTGAGPRHGLLARPQDACHRLDRIEFGDVHRHRDECGQARHLCRPFAARGVLHAGRKGSLGHRARRELHQRHRRREFCREEAHRGAGRPRHADLLARRQIRLHLLVLQSGDRRGVSRRPRHRRARQAGKPVLPEHRRHA